MQDAIIYICLLFLKFYNRDGLLEARRMVGGADLCLLSRIATYTSYRPNKKRSQGTLFSPSTHRHLEDSGIGSA